MKKHLKRIAVGGIVIGASVAVSLVVFYEYFYIPHFSIVQEGVLYRSGQPGEGDLQRLRDAYGIRTVVNLRRENEQTGEKGLPFEQERAEVDRLGMHFIHLPMEGDDPVDTKTVDRWLEIVRDKDNWPILVHCKQGVDRTGLLAAVYRIKVQGWAPEKALAEAIKERMDPEDEPQLKKYILACPAAE